MRSLPFSLLVLACLAGLLALRFGLEFAVPSASAHVAEAASPEAGQAMAVPPKPEGLPQTPGNGEGEGPALSLEGCLEMSPIVQDTCWQALARQTAGADPDEALRVCRRIAAGEMEFECEADIAETIAIPHRERAESICAAIADAKWSGQCNFGIGLALAETDPEYAIGRCANAGVFQTFCRHDVIGEMSLVNVPAAVAICAREEGDWLTRKTCWHGMGKYLARRDVSEAAAACAQATEAWRSNCFHGLGWGAAERDPGAALAGCASLGSYADNCRMGVAYELKRADPGRSVALCQALVAADMQARCLEFVTR